MSTSEITVPDIGDFDDVPVIEILVGVGDTVAPEDPLVTLESDKATMDVPAPIAGTVQSLAVSIGDRVSQGSVLMTFEPDGDGPATKSDGDAPATEADGGGDERPEVVNEPAPPPPADSGLRRRP